jgi:hypothetical protein
MRKALLKSVFLVSIFLLGSSSLESVALTNQPSFVLQNPAQTANLSSPSAFPDHDLLNSLNNHVKQLDLDIINDLKKTKPSDNETNISTGLIAALAVLCAAGIGALGQYMVAKMTATIARNEAVNKAEIAKLEARYRHTDKIVDYRLKQLELFYAPMSALMGQSGALSYKLQLQLSQENPIRYRFDSQTPPRLHIFDENKDTGEFRLLDQLPALRTSSTAWALVSQIVATGTEMESIIRKHAGFASENLISRLSEYMAHYAILSTLYKESETVPFNVGEHKVGYFPRELPGELLSGYRNVSSFLDEYAKATLKVLQDSNQQHLNV